MNVMHCPTCTLVVRIRRLAVFKVVYSLLAFVRKEIICDLTSRASQQGYAPRAASKRRKAGLIKYCLIKDFIIIGIVNDLTVL
jgi:hypothetical protein